MTFLLKESAESSAVFLPVINWKKFIGPSLSKDIPRILSSVSMFVTPYDEVHFEWTSPIYFGLSCP